MNEVAFRLESFSPLCTASAEVLRKEGLEDAFRRGLAEGRAMGFSEELRQLTEAMRALDAKMTDIAAIRTEAERQAVASVLPILNEIVATLATRAESAGLEAAISDELVRLVDTAPAPGWHILCPPGMEAMMRRCAATAGIAAPDIRVGQPLADASIMLEQGRSAFSQERVAEHFRNLISELQESYR